MIVNNERLNRFALTFAIISAIIIIIGKFFGWVATSSNSILASLFDSILDVVSSIVNMVAFIFSSRPADEKHRFGHEKIEDLAVFVQSSFFGVSGFDYKV